MDCSSLMAVMATLNFICKAAKNISKLFNKAMNGHGLMREPKSVALLVSSLSSWIGSKALPCGLCRLVRPSDGNSQKLTLLLLFVKTPK